MIPEVLSRSAARLLLPLALLAALLAPCFGQDGGAFGLNQARLAEILAGKEIAPLLALGEKELEDTGAFGPAAYYYLARWLDARVASPAPPSSAPTSSAPESAASLVRLLYRRAYDRGSGLVRREAGVALLRNQNAAELWDELLTFASEFEKKESPSWEFERQRLDALDALGRSAEEAALAAFLPSAYPAEAAKEADALAYYSAAAGLRSGSADPPPGPADRRPGAPAWRGPFRRLLLERPYSDWSARAYALAQAEPRLRAAFSEEELHALAMRDAVRRKDFGAAYREALLAPGAALSRAASQALVADAGKAFLYAGRAKEGEAPFAALEAAAAKPPVPKGPQAGAGWTALFYRARFARALSRWGEAASLFRRAGAGAAAKADADSCRWYAVDSAYQGAMAIAASIEAPVARAAVESGARASLLEALIAASASWSESGTFSDLAGGLFRDALRARDWGLIESMARRLGGRLEADAAAPVEYAAGRAFELGLGTEPEADADARAAKAAVRFAAVADEAAAPLYYRALASWRAGVEPLFVQSEAEAADQGTAEAPGEIEALVNGMAGFGLVDMALAEAKARAAGLSGTALRRLAAGFSSRGRPDCAIRLALELGSRPDYRPRRSDYELLYPRPYLGEIRSLRLGDRLPEPLAYGLIRSESAFKADAQSRAGAVGLAQLMPATAAGQAKALGLSSYDLTKPKDNLAIGLAHFASLLDRSERRPLRAMMAYNAGWGRLRAWTAESGDLPDDLLVEALGIGETRQYCRNILQAAVMYGLLYYGRSVADTVGELVGEK
jgi:soluble lytic murein transglycosylase-like protein